MQEESAYMRDLMWLTQNQGRKFDAAVFHDVVNRFMHDGESEGKARLLALETMKRDFVRRTG